MADIQTLPFTIDPELADIRKGWITIGGVLRVEPGRVVLEYRTSIATLEQSEIKMRSIGLDQLTRVDYRRGIFSAKLILQAKSLTVFEGMPGSSEDRLVLSIARRDAPTAKVIGWELGTALENRKLAPRPSGTPDRP
ncbi:MAG TPA: hypothetical protein VK845_04525 [Gemmatimonadales bacterium]|nr:hypothetical protein [Gemmatimonadales bacterium]